MVALFAEVRQEFISTALESFPRLVEVLNQLTEAELHAALKLEADSRRRPTTLDRMIRRLTHLIEQRSRRELKEKYMHEPSDVMKAEVPKAKKAKPSVKKKPKAKKK